MPCCGNVSEEDIASVAAIGREGKAMSAPKDGGSVELYTQIRGKETQIGWYGVATNTTPCVVPESVAAELAEDKTLGPAPLAPLPQEAAVPAEDVAAETAEDEGTQPRRRERRSKE